MIHVYHNDRFNEQYTPEKIIPVSIVLENLRSAFNVGSIFRTSDAFRIDKIYLTGYTPGPPNPKLKKTALGAEDKVKWERIEDIFEFIDQKKRDNHTVYAVERTNSSYLLSKTDIRFPAVFIFGNEVTGVSPYLLNKADRIIEIPMYGYKNSINVATAAGIILYKLSELIRTETYQATIDNPCSLVH